MSAQDFMGEKFKIRNEAVVTDSVIAFTNLGLPLQISANSNCAIIKSALPSVTNKVRCEKRNLKKVYAEAIAKEELKNSGKTSQIKDDVTRLQWSKSSIKLHNPVSVFAEVEGFKAGTPATIVVCQHDFENDKQIEIANISAKVDKLSEEIFDAEKNKNITRKYYGINSELYFNCNNKESSKKNAVQANIELPLEFSFYIFIESKTYKSLQSSVINISEKTGIKDGFHFLPLIGVSWIPYPILCDAILVLANKFSGVNSKFFLDERAAKNVSCNHELFKLYISFIADYDGNYLDIDAATSLKYFKAIENDTDIATADKHQFFNLLPLAISSNVFPGKTDISIDECDNTIDIEAVFDEGLGEYRGYCHFVPWVKVEQGEVIDYGILNQKKFKPNQGGTKKLTGKLSYDLTVPQSSSSITPLSRLGDLRQPQNA